MAVRLDFLTQDPDEIALAVRYWAVDENGDYLEKVSELVPFREVVQSGLISKYVRQYCLAYDENCVCAHCDGAMLVLSRTDTKKTLQRSVRPCEGCAKVIAERDLKLKQAEMEELQWRLAERIEYVCSRAIAYDGLPDDICLILLAVDALVAPRLAKGTFREGDCAGLVPYSPESYIARLYEDGVIIDDPGSSVSGAYFIRDGRLKMNWASVELFLPGDRQLGRGGEALEIITQREFVDSEAIAILWQDYAVGDVIRYLLDQCYIYGLELYDEDIEKVQATVRFGLRSYSVSQLWFIMWKVVKDAASLASREYYNRLKAAATIPSKIRKQLEKADSEGGIRRGWDRPENHLAGSLGMVLLELFGINEYTKGSEVIEILSQLGGTSEGRCREDMRALVSSFMKVAIESEASVAFMEKFAEFIRSGLETRAALEEVMKDDC